MKRILIGLLFLLGCSKTPISTTGTANPEIPVSLLFEHDGCKVYRFDDGRFVYFTKCGSTQTSYTESCGKNCTRTVDVHNITLPSCQETP